MSIHSYLSFLRIHENPQYAEPAVAILAKQWGHKENEQKRNLKSMLEDSRDSLPCHLALILNIPGDQKIDNKDHEKLLELHCPRDSNIVVGHVKLAKADGRSDGACCISYSLLVDDVFRGLGLGRALTEQAENYARSLVLSYMYLSTDDKVTFYEHLGYNQCESVSSLGSNSKRLNANQVSALEGLFAKRLNVCNPTECNTWLRKRLIEHYPLQSPLKSAALLSTLASQINGLSYDTSCIKAPSYVAYYNPMYWQQQTGPSCGISAMNMVNASVKSRSPVKEDSNTCAGCTKLKDRQEEVIAEGQSALSVAVKSGVSNDGELFCAFNFKYVAQKALVLPTTVVTAEWNVVSFFKEICSGFPILVPYDRSLSDHRPVLLKGSQAHWAVIMGFILPGDETTPQGKESCQLQLQSGQSKLTTVNVNDNCDGKFPNATLVEALGEGALIICTHSMSKTPFVCSFEEMRQSNLQLLNSKSKFYLASEDLCHLRGKALFIDH